MEVEKNLVLLCKEILTDSQTTYNNGGNGPKSCALCRDADGSCSDAERATHCVYHVADGHNNFWSGRALTGEHILDCVRQTNVRFRGGLPMSARVYVCELCFTHHAVIRSNNAPHETPEGRLVCGQCFTQ
jgi:hypothetical protein